MLKIGQDVWVTDQSPAAEGVIVDVSTWGKINNSSSNEVCYHIRCKDWMPEYRWISAMFVKAIQKGK